MADLLHYYSFKNGLENQRKLHALNPSPLTAFWIAQFEHELNSEVEFLASKGVIVGEPSDISDDDLLKELLS